MEFNIKEVSSIPPIAHHSTYNAHRFDPLVDACMKSSTGIVSYRCESVKKARSDSAGLRVYLGRMGLQDEFEVNQRAVVVFLTDKSRG